MLESFSKLMFLINMYPLVTETSEFWRNVGEYNECDSSSIQTEVFRLPTTCFAEEEGTLVNSGRWLQWHWKGAEPPGAGNSDIEIMGRIYQRQLALDKKEGGKYTDPIVNVDWPYSTTHNPTPHNPPTETNGTRTTGKR